MAHRVLVHLRTVVSGTSDAPCGTQLSNRLPCMHHPPHTSKCCWMMPHGAASGASFHQVPARAACRDQQRAVSSEHTGARLERTWRTRRAAIDHHPLWSRGLARSRGSAVAAVGTALCSPLHTLWFHSKNGPGRRPRLVEAGASVCTLFCRCRCCISDRSHRSPFVDHPLWCEQLA